ncbi:MAG: hypothetical protein J4452_04495 [Candidatus Aenigmarchaeota archaeon]|nr:hypothetical protein [Candidatus Aenigmarchaeota archaeon]
MKINRCPKCDSARIGLHTFSALWICKSCGYRGPLVVTEQIAKEKSGKGQ